MIITWPPICLAVGGGGGASRRAFNRDLPPPPQPTDMGKVVRSALKNSVALETIRTMTTVVRERSEGTEVCVVGSGAGGGGRFARDATVTGIKGARLPFSCSMQCGG